MNNATIVIVIVAVLAGLVLAVIWRYRASGEAKFSIHKLLRFSFKGSNRQEDTRAQHKGVRLEAGANVQAGDVIGGDKVTTINVSAPHPGAPIKTPRLRLSLFEYGRADTYHLGIEIAQGNAPHGNRYLIGLALENEQDDAPARGVQMTLSFYWSGEPPNRAIECQYSPQQGEEDGRHRGSHGYRMTSRQCWSTHNLTSCASAGNRRSGEDWPSRPEKG